MKYYTVTGKSTEKPEGLPDGLRVEETDDGTVSVGSAGRSDDYYGVHLRKVGFFYEISLRAGERPWTVNDGMSFNRAGVAALRDALIELIGDEPAKPKAPAVVNHGDPEPPRDAVYIDNTGDVWAYRTNGWTWRYEDESRWHFQRPWNGTEGVTGHWPETFPWTLKTA